VIYEVILMDLSTKRLNNAPVYCLAFLLLHLILEGLYFYLHLQRDLYTQFPDISTTKIEVFAFRSFANIDVTDRPVAMIAGPFS
jgi:hypothetical protein